MFVNISANGIGNEDIQIIPMPAVIDWMLAQEFKPIRLRSLIFCYNDFA